MNSKTLQPNLPALETELLSQVTFAPYDTANELVRTAPALSLKRTLKED